jgi:hypothetical protein
LRNYDFTLLAVVEILIGSFRSDSGLESVVLKKKNRRRKENKRNKEKEKKKKIANICKNPESLVNTCKKNTFLLLRPEHSSHSRTEASIDMPLQGGRNVFARSTDCSAGP